MDFNADLHFKKCLRELCEKWKEPTTEEWSYWKLCTEKMLKVMKPLEIVHKVLTIAEGLSDKEWMQGYPKDIFNEEKEYKPINAYGKSLGENKALSDGKISMIIKSYGIKLKGKQCICPFHDDTQASLSIDDDKNVFFCHGCNVKGDIITFVKKMEGKNGN